VLAALVIVGAVLRVAVNDVERFSPADEGHYVRAARWLAERGPASYGELVRAYLGDRAEWAFPTPIRWGYLGAAGLACAAKAPCDGRALAWLSTLSGTLAIALTFALGARLVGRRAALLAAAFTVTSPLQLAMGRRALADEPYCAAFLLAFWALVRLVQDDGEARGARGRIALFIGASTLAFAVKEVFAFPYVGLAAVYALAPRQRSLGRGDALILAAPPLIFFAVFAAWSGSARAFFELLSIGQASFLSEYSLQYQSGPPHRPLFDLFLLSPIVCLAAAGALALIAARVRRSPGGERWLALFLVIALAAFVGLPKNVRFVVILDPVLRLLAAWMIVTWLWGGPSAGPRREVLAAAVSATPELHTFLTIFLDRKTYDPTTHDLLLAQDAIPGAPRSPSPSQWPIVFFVASALAITALFIGRRKPVKEPQNDETERGGIGEGSGGGERGEGALSPAPVAARGAGRRERAINLAIAGVCIVAALFVGRSWGLRSASPTGESTSGEAPANDASASARPAPAPPRESDPAAAEMSAGLAAADPAVAIAHFRKALEINPTHYGATFQLAQALERAGRADEARQQWGHVLAFAEQARDQALIDMARARVAAPPPAAANADPMAQGLDALYTKRDPAAAVPLFRQVLAQNPEHYGATYQLATALDQSGKPAEARPLWEKVLKMAGAIGDTRTADTARTRLSRRP
jgi:Flp pilus assembly protein TadD